MAEDDIRTTHVFLGIYIARITIDRVKLALESKIKELDQTLNLLDTIIDNAGLSDGEFESLEKMLGDTLAKAGEGEEEQLIAKLMALNSKKKQKH